MIYLDNAATTKLRPEVLAAMMPYLKNRYGNPSGIYSFSSDIKQDINSARRILASSINADEDEIFITSGGTESDNWALKMTAEEHTGGNLITTKIEHHAILRTCKFLENRGISVTYLDTDENGMVKLDQLEDAIRPETFLVSVMTANNEVGTIQPIEEIGEIAAKRGVLFHTDAVQAFTNVPINVKQMNIGLLSTSGHKINGPKGVGFLYIKKGSLKTPFIDGGGQERGMRAGTENVAGMVGLSKAAELAVKTMKIRTQRECQMRDYMIKRVLGEIPFSRLNGHPVKRLPNNMNFSFQFTDGAALIVMLDKQGICASAGSACSSGSSKPSHVLKAIGLPDEIAYSTVRFTINEEITINEINYVVNCLKKDVEELRSMSEDYRLYANGSE